MLFTILILVLTKVVIQHQVLDALLLLLRRLPLVDQGHGEVRVRGQFNRARLGHVSYNENRSESKHD